MKIAVVTGGTGALGSAVADAFLGAGYETYVTARHLDEATAYQGAAHAVTVDLGDFEAMKTWAAELGDVHAIVLCAGGFGMGPLLDHPAGLWEQMLNVNLKTAANALQAFGPHMPSGAAAVLVGSQAFEGAASMAAYAASKAAVISLARSASLEWKSCGIRVNSILPDTIDTPANRAAMPKANFDGWAKPEEVASVALWLCSASAAVVSGNAIRLGR